MAFTDDFTESSTVDLENHTPSGGTAWTKVEASNGAEILQVSGSTNRLITNTDSGSGDTSYQCDDQGSANHYVQGDWEDASQGLNHSFLCNRLTDRDDYIGIRVRSDNIEVYKNVSASLTQLGSTGSTTVNDGDTIKLESDSSDVHTAFINDVEESGPGGTDSHNNTETRQGAVGRSSIVAGLIDNFEAAALAAGGGAAHIPSGLALLGVGS